MCAYRRGNRGRGNSYDSGGSSRFSEHDDRSRVETHHQSDRSTSRGGYRGNRRGSRGQGNYRGNRGRRHGNRPPRSHYSSGRGSKFRSDRAPSGGQGDNGNFDQDDDGDVNMEGTETRRFNPYARPTKNYDRKPRHNNNNNQQSRREPTKNWYQITVLQGSTLDEEWLKQEIQTLAMVQFHPVQYHLDGNHSCFFVDDHVTAGSIRDCSRKITSPDGNKVAILMRPYNQSPISNDKIPKIQEVLASKYKSDTHHLDASALFSDEVLRGEKIFLRVQTSAHMHIIARIIAQNISTLKSLDVSNNRLFSFDGLKHLIPFTPFLQELNLAKNSLKSIKELEKISSWDLIKLTLDGNPLCSQYTSQTEYISDVREWFPNLTSLDGHTLPAPVKFDVEKVELPTSVLDFVQTPNGADTIKMFVAEYFKCYDQSRAMLAAAYHDNCLFTISIPPSARGPPLSKYFKHSRNLKQIKNMSQKISTISQCQADVLAKLQLLPKSEHDFSSFHLDILLVTSEVTNFIVRGIYKEVETNGLLRAFSRSFVCQVTGNGLKIINEQFFVRNPTPQEIKDSKATTTKNKIPSAPVATNAPSHDDMIASFSRESGMNVGFSRQCLEENEWNYEKAGQTFLELNGKGAIPAEAFVK
ncbi:nuclear RNA export factor 1 [Ciona intestinalis]